MIVPLADVGFSHVNPYIRTKRRFSGRREFAERLSFSFSFSRGHLHCRRQTREASSRRASLDVTNAAQIALISNTQRRLGGYRRNARYDEALGSWLSKAARACTSARRAKRCQCVSVNGAESSRAPLIVIQREDDFANTPCNIDSLIPAAVNGVRSRWQENERSSERERERERERARPISTRIKSTRVISTSLGD